MLKLAYDAKRLFTNFTGLGNYSRTLLHDLSINFPDQAYYLFTPKIQKNKATHFFSNSPMFKVSMPKKGNKLGWRTFGIKKELIKQEIDIFHGLSHEIPMGVHKTGIKSVVTIHDLVFKHYPEQYKYIDRSIYNFKFNYACQNSDKIVAISESTKQDIVKFYNIKPSKIKVIYQSCHTQFKQQQSPSTIEAIVKKYKLPSNFVLYVGSVIERKNLLNIIKALEILPKNSSPHLVVVGDGGVYKKTVQNYIQSHHLEKQVSFIAANFEDLPALYQKATAFLYPSFYEGFGIPVIEALHSHTPVITSNISSLPEAAGEDSIQVNPASFEEIADATERVLTDDNLKQQMIQKGAAYVQKFDGDQAARNMMQVYENLGT